MQSSQFIAPFKRLFRWLVVGLLLLGLFSITASILVRESIEHWLRQRGMETQIDHLYVSIPTLSLYVHGVRIKNDRGRGFRARELMLNYSWWQLLRGRMQLQEAYLDGAHMDLESRWEDGRRFWEIGGLRLGAVPPAQRDLRLLFERLRVHDSRLCYRHRPQWQTPTCIDFTELRAQDFLVRVLRRGDDPLQLTIGADRLHLRNLLARDGRDGDPNTALVKLDLEEALFKHPGNRITAARLEAEHFASCPPERWAEVRPGLRRVIGHCGAARKLQLEGELLFSFGPEARAQWQRASGQGILLRHSNRRYPNWRADTLAMNRFRYTREEKKLTWHRAGATAFDWCPSAWRNREHHYCVRAGTLQLPEPVVFDWSQRLNVHTTGGRLQQTRLLDRAGDVRNPLTLNDTLIGELNYTGAERSLEFRGLEMGSASGCIPGSLWKTDDFCLRMAGLRTPEPLQIRFASRREGQPWGFDSGQLTLAEFSLKREGQPQLQVRELRWQHISLSGSGSPLRLQDFDLKFLSGCLPDALLPRRLRSLCADVRRLSGVGNFAWTDGDDGFLILGELWLERMLLADRLNGDRGLLLRQLHTGHGYFRRQSDTENPWIDDSRPRKSATSLASAEADDGGEKGLLPDERAADDRGAAQVPDVRRPNLQLERLSLSSLQGCLPHSWARLLYQEPRQMPGCFDLLNLRQHQPLKVAWGGGVDLIAAELTLDRAETKTLAGGDLFSLSGLRVPEARVRYLQWNRSADFFLPYFSLEGFNGCLPSSVASPVLDIRCADLSDVRLGENFQVQIDRRQVSANLNGTLARRILLTEQENQVVIDVQKFLAPRLEIAWLRDTAKATRLKIKNVSAAQLHGCLPQDFTLRSGLPRCISTSDLRTVGAEEAPGLTLGRTLLKVAPVAEPLWRIEAVEVARLSLTPDALELYGLEVHQLLACGLWTLLPENARAWGIADCIAAEDLQFAGVSRIGLTPAVARLELGELNSEAIALWQEEGEYAQVGLQRLSWKKLRWNGGPVVWVTDLRIHDFQGCPVGPVEQVAAQVAEAAKAPVGDSCIRLGDLYLPGTQRLSLAPPFSFGGSIVLADLSIGNRSGEPWEFARVQLDQLTYGGDGLSIGSLSGLSGCLPAGWLGDTRLAPCYQLGPMRLQGIERVDTPAGRIIELHGLVIDGARLIQADYPKGQAQLLQLESLSAGVLRFGAGEVSADDLRMSGISGCIPRGYISRVDHCVAADSLETRGNYRGRDGGGLALDSIRLEQPRILSAGGERLVRGDSVWVEQLFASERQLRFQYAEAGGVAFFGRAEDAPDYGHHAWSGEVELLRVDRLHYDRVGDHLDIASVDMVRPKAILVRDRLGEFPLRRKVAALTGEMPTLARAGEAVTEKLKFRYRIGDVNIDSGMLTWIDHLGRFRSRLPVREINLRLINASSHPLHPPAILLVNARPGGLGEVQLAGFIDYKDTRKWDANLTGYLKNVNLIPASPYMANLLGYKILQGQVDATMDIRIVDNKVDALSEIVLNKIKVRRVRDGDSLPVEKTLIPLNIALALLRDGKGNVRFSMPITGDLYDPKFSFSFIFGDLLQRAIMEALFSYFTPLGFYTLARLAWERFRAVRFKPVPFAPGSDELSMEAREHLADVVSTLRERPEARPGICGVATARDWIALYPASTPGMRGSRKARETFYRFPPTEIHEELEELADRRSQRVQLFLLNSGITADKFIQCAPDYNGRDFEEPRVELSN
ncbi:MULTISPECIES: DUF748 domain-containing protein [unclassified Microbulbifer]|uniref:DUF748 domain-containing protein n=1 Tax=unclassified Microbulbifer TaxID=2619833 RepID=UPI0027E48CA4|nr:MULTISPECIES: DUF748 domain-containing protein [unclassified Microbulbifer]